MQQRKVLIVDDDALWLRITAELFEAYKYKAYAASSCADAIKLTGQHKMDCVLLDYHLLDGKADKVSLAIRRDGELKTTPIIIISGDEREELNSYLKCQADAFILKGAQFEKVLAVVESVVRRAGWEKGVLEKDDLRLEQKELRVLRNKKAEILLSPDQFRLLSLLVERSPEYVSDREIADRLKLDAGEENDSEAVRALVYRLRKKLGPQLALRIKDNRKLGWGYFSPRYQKDRA